MDGQALGIAHIGQVAEELEAVDEFLASRNPALNAETEDRPGAFGQVFLHGGMVRAAGQAGVADPCYFGMGVQELGRFLCVLHVAFHAQAERFQSLQEEERIERRDAAANVAQHLDARPGNKCRSAQVGKDQPMIGVIRLVEIREARISFPFKIAAVHDHAADGGAVPADELGGGMDDDIRAPLERPEKVRCGKRVVDHQRDAEFMSDGSNFFKRKNIDARVAQCLAIDQLGIRPDSAAEILGIARIDKGHLDPQPRQGVGELVIGPAIKRGGRDDVVAGAGQGKDRLRSGRHGLN